ncbi:Uncharacterised protein [uncultured archaeon]|nr:Uncharacterised protein [uncultured archaeon]
MQLVCTDKNSGCLRTAYRLDTDANSEVSFGAWQTFTPSIENAHGIVVSSDGNYAIDFNSTDNAGKVEPTNRAYVTLDKNAPAISITSPGNGSSQSSATVTIGYAGTDATSGIEGYHVSSDGTTWIDNGTSTTYSFTGQASGSHTYYAKATDKAGNNSPSASVTVTISASTGSNDTATSNNTGNSGSGGSGGGGGGGGGTASQGYISQEMLDDPANLLSKTVYAGKTMTLENGLQSNRDAIYRRVKSSGAAISYYTFTITITNTTGNSITNIIIDENIPKDTAQAVDKIYFDDKPARIISEDPEIQWDINQLDANTSKTFTYTTIGLANQKKQLNFQNYAGTLSAPKITAQQKQTDKKTQDTCTQNCDDNNPCTTDTCTGGKCSHTTKTECTASQNITAQKTAQENQKTDDNMPAIAAAAALLIATLGITAHIRKSKTTAKTAPATPPAEQPAEPPENPAMNHPPNA